MKIRILKNENLKNEPIRQVELESNLLKDEQDPELAREELDFDFFKDALFQVTVWSKRLFVLGILGLGLYGILGFISLFLNPLGTVQTFIVIGVLAIPLVYLKNFNDRVSEGVFANNNKELYNGIINLKKAFQFQFVCILVLIGFYLALFGFNLIFLRSMVEYTY